MKRVLLVAVITALASTSAFAQTKKSAKSESKKQAHSYGMAGCGLGSVVFKDEPGMIQIVAQTLNDTAIQTFAITSGTSNCGETPKVAKATQFIEVNKIALENDLARGQGESLAALSQVLECKNQQFGTEMKKSYQTNFPQGGASVQQIQAVAYSACQI
jgi:hypothetical protein